MNSQITQRRFRVIAPAYPDFNVYSQIARLTTTLGPLCVATVVSRMPGWQAEVVDENNYRRPAPRDHTGHPDHAALQAERPANVVGLYGGLSCTAPRVLELARRYKAMGATTVVGGQHFVGDNIRHALTNGVDYVVIGEGEYTIVELLSVIMGEGDPSGVAGIAFMRDGDVVQTETRAPITDFEHLPLPDFSLVRHARVSVYPVGWVRGCGMDCEFCTVKGKPRAASVERVMTQITTLIENYGARRFFIVDDLFGHNRADALRVCRSLAEYQQQHRVHLDIIVQVRLDRARDEELLAAMAGAGVTTVGIGFESPIAEELAAMDKRIKPEDMLMLAQRFHDAGFFVHGMFIFGYPLPDGVQLSLTVVERVQRFKEFIRSCKLDTLQILMATPLPGTAMTARLVAAGRMFPLESVGFEYYDGNYPVFRPDQPFTVASFRAATQEIVDDFYHWWSLLAVLRNLLTYPLMMGPLRHTRYGRRRWERLWRRDLLRAGGWLQIRWRLRGVKRGPFWRKAAQAEAALSGR
jgi:radical SAM superfamily enzyme YgiQ (UPF0313 family)